MNEDGTRRWRQFAGAVALSSGLAVAVSNSGASADRGHTDAGVSVRGAAVEHGEHGEARQLGAAEITHLLTTINTEEIGLARLALERSRDAEVRRFANEMIAGHQEAQDRIDAWMQLSSTTPTASPVSEEVERNADDVRRSLASAEDFERAYVASQVAMHGDALRLLDERVLPGARDASLRALVRRIRRGVVHHLDMARALERSIR